MNQLQGEISNIEQYQQLIRVELDTLGQKMHAIILDQGGEAGFKPVVRNKCSILFKETEVSLAKGEAVEISISNKLSCTITSIEGEEILSRVGLDCCGEIIFSVLSSSELKRLDLQIGDLVTALVKENEVMLAE